MDGRRTRGAVAGVVLCALIAAGCGGSGGSGRDVPVRHRSGDDVGTSTAAGPAGGAAAARDLRAAARVDAGAGIAAAPGGTGGVLVDVAGAVRHPGVYRLPRGAHVYEAIAAAGGAKPGAQLALINRAAPVVDGQQVLVAGARSGASAGSGAPIAGSASGGSGGAAATGAHAAPVSLNSADVAAIDTLPGIGPVTAARIVADRDANGPFASVDDLDRVPGIGPTTLEQLRPLVTP